MTVLSFHLRDSLVSRPLPETAFDGRISQAVSRRREPPQATADLREVLVAKAWNSQLHRSIGREQPSAPPLELDYDLWVGPAA